NNGNGFNLPTIGQLNNSPFNDPNMIKNIIPGHQQAQSLIFDYNGDGKEDFPFVQMYTSESNPITANQQKYWIYLSTGSNLSTPINIVSNDNPQYSSIIANTMPLTGDFDGDGKSEILALNTLLPSNSPTGTANPSYIIGEKYNTYT